jgi:hypothetical protein
MLLPELVKPEGMDKFDSGFAKHKKTLLIYRRAKITE